MKISERVGQLLDIGIVNFETREKVVDLLVELNEEISSIVMNSRNMKNSDDYIKLYQDIKDIIRLINEESHLTIMDKEVDILTSNMIEEVFK